LNNVLFTTGTLLHTSLRVWHLTAPNAPKMSPLHTFPDFITLNAPSALSTKELAAI